MGTETYALLPNDHDDMMLLTTNLGHYTAMTRLPDGRDVWVLDQTGPITHNDWIQYLSANNQTFMLIREDGCHIHIGTSPSLPEVSDRYPRFMTNRGGRWFFNDAYDDTPDSDDEIFGDQEEVIDEDEEILDVDDDVEVKFGVCHDRTNVHRDIPPRYDPAENHRFQRLTRKRLVKSAVKLLIKRAREVPVGSIAAQFTANTIINDYNEEFEASKEN
jgi:hypothetical protein